MISVLLFVTLLGLACATYPTYTSSGSYFPYTAGGIQGQGFQFLPYSTGGIGNVGLQTYFPSTYNTFGNGYYPTSSYLFNTVSYPTVVSHYLYFPGGNPWEPGRNFIDLRVNPYPWYLQYYGGLGTGFGSTTFPGTYSIFGSSLGYPTGYLTTGYPEYGSGGYFPIGNIGGHFHKKKIY